MDKSEQAKTKDKRGTLTTLMFGVALGIALTLITNNVVNYLRTPKEVLLNTSSAKPGAEIAIGDGVANGYR